MGNPYIFADILSYELQRLILKLFLYIFSDICMCSIYIHTEHNKTKKMTESMPDAEQAKLEL